MTIVELATLVRQMRKAQHGWFLHRRQDFLTEAKVLERKVDKIVKEILTLERQSELELDK